MSTLVHSTRLKMSGYADVFGAEISTCVLYLVLYSTGQIQLGLLPVVPILQYSCTIARQYMYLVCTRLRKRTSRLHATVVLSTCTSPSPTVDTHAIPEIGTPHWSTVLPWYRTTIDFSSCRMKVRDVSYRPHLFMAQFEIAS